MVLMPAQIPTACFSLGASQAQLGLSVSTFGLWVSEDSGSFCKTGPAEDFARAEFALQAKELPSIVVKPATDKWGM